MISTMQRERAQIAQTLMGYADLYVPLEFIVVTAALSRMSRRGEGSAFSKGRYCRPIMSRIGPIPPSDASTVKN